MIDRRMEACITWKESLVNSTARRAWTSEAAEFLRSNYRPHSGVFTTFGDITGIFQRAGIPLHDTLTWDNSAYWTAAAARPDRFLHEEWAVAQGGDKVQSAVNRAFLRGPRYTLQKTVMVKDAPVIEIYRRDAQYWLGEVDLAAPGDERQVKSQKAKVKRQKLRRKRQKSKIESQ
jgi:hypothetical protein